MTRKKRASDRTGERRVKENEIKNQSLVQAERTKRKQRKEDEEKPTYRNWHHHAHCFVLQAIEYCVSFAFVRVLTHVVLFSRLKGEKEREEIDTEEEGHAEC